jgi:hypothetical protein
MKIRDALSIEGTSNLGILCYGIFDAAHLDDAAVALNQKTDSDISEVHPLIDDGWPNALLLNEIIVSNADDVDKIVSNAFDRMFEIASCKAAVCMYDGAFASYEDVFGSDAASQTYAFCFPGEDPVFAADSEAMESEDWLSVIEKARSRLSC